MAMDKAILHGKEHRKPYTKSRAVDRSCRNHGSCGYCENNRTAFDKRHRQAADLDLKEWRDNG